MSVEYFDECIKIFAQIDDGDLSIARESLCELLAKFHKNGIREYPPVVSRACRELGLYPYITENTADWEDAFAKVAFEVDTGGREQCSLHIEQSKILKRLLQGENIALSAPTSFGKSFLVDAYIAIKKPANVVIIVPTVALMDEVRRRLTRKFGFCYNVITLPEEKPLDKNIFVFPQERVFSHIRDVSSIDLLVVDEFYKAATDGDDEQRVTTLQKAITDLMKISKQRYYLMPNVSSVNVDSPLMSGMKCIDTDFQTVKIQVYNKYRDYSGIKTKSAVKNRKRQCLSSILNQCKKTLIYVGLNRYIKDVRTCFEGRLVRSTASRYIELFSQWLAENYGNDFYLANLVKSGCGVHNGVLNRALCQLQVSLFSEPDGLDSLISTSSIIEGVNTAAENVVLWSSSIGNLRGSKTIDYFTYKNIAGRAGRMFRYFVGTIYNLEPPPTETLRKMEFNYTDDCTLQLAADTIPDNLPPEKNNMVADFFSQASALVLDFGELKRLLHSNEIKMNLPKFLEALKSMSCSKDWPDVELLNIPVNDVQSDSWFSKINYLLYGPLKGALNSVVRTKFKYFAPIVVFSSQGWDIGITGVLTRVKLYLQRKYNEAAATVDCDTYFRAEKEMIYGFANILSNYNYAYNLTHEEKVNITPFLSRLSRAFLPGPVFYLEEFGLPRSLSKLIHDAGLVDMVSEEQTAKAVIAECRKLGFSAMRDQLQISGKFEEYILARFFEGI